MGWANKLLGWTSNNGAEVNGDGALRVVDGGAGGSCYTVSAKTGTVGAAIAAGGCVFAMRVNPGSTKKAYVDSIRLRFTTIVAYTTPITQTRSLVITRGAGNATAGGTSIPVATKKDTGYPLSQADLGLGGDVRIATTAALTVTGITWEATNMGEMTLAHVGAAGSFYECVYEFTVRNHPIELNPGELLGVRVGASAMDAAGTWSLGVEVAWREGTSDVE